MTFFYLSQDIIYSFSFFIEDFYCYDNYCIVLGWNKEKILYSLCQYIHFFIVWNSFYSHFLCVFACISALFLYQMNWNEMLVCPFNNIECRTLHCSVNVLEASLNTVSLKVFVKKCYFFLSENLTFHSKVSFCLHLPSSTDDVWGKRSPILAI